MTKKHKYPVNKDIGLKVGNPIRTEFAAFEQSWDFLVANQSAANIAKSCLTYYKPMWDGSLHYEISNRDTVADIGAHMGFFSIPISSQVANVVAFEPAPANFELLQKNIALNKRYNIAAFNKAVGDEVGSTTLYLGVQGTTGHSITNKKRGNVSIEIETVNLEYIVAKFNPTVLKIDCEGGEWVILTNPDTLKDVQVIVAELHKVTEDKMESLLQVMNDANMQYNVQPNSWFTKLIAWRM